MALSLIGKHILSRRQVLFNSVRNNGYIILVPEFGEDLPEKNPLLQNDGLPEFNNITIENCMAAIAKQTLDLEAGVKEIENSLQGKGTNDIFKDVFESLEEMGTPLDLTWDNISAHCDSEDKLPPQMFDSLLEVHKHLAGIDLSRELYLAALDLELHHCKDYWLDVVKKLWPQFRSFPLDKLDSHPCSFTQIFTDEWAAAYYSHIWSRMIAADVYSAFHEVQGDERKIKDVGKRFRDTFLALGGSCHPSRVFRKFRGRDPSPNALLKSLGLKNIKAEKQ
ncbi:hypothetical protein MTP99_018542 [Tenebrio molitor]|nr:hypothetical protein MTP99_018542 [Tenebrio molitor]